MKMNHPNEETLTAYLTSDFPEPHAADVEQHLDGCDQCLTSIMAIHRNLGHGLQAAVHVPPALVVQASGGQGPRRRKVPMLLRYPVLIPLSLAAGLALAVGIENWPASRRPDATRAVDLGAQTASVIAAEALVLKQPDERADVVGHIVRGDTVTIEAKQGAWTRIVLADGVSGWVAARVLE
jgi:anti-sigma factor RsiW